jgi:hypothetical protein
MWSRLVNLFRRKPQQWELQIPFEVDKVSLKKEIARYPDVHIYRTGSLDVTEFSKEYLIVNLENSVHSNIRLILRKEDIQALQTALETKTELGFRKPKHLHLKTAI